MFWDDEGFRRACPGLVLPALAALLGLQEQQVLVARMDAVRAIKISLSRRHSAGSPRDPDTLCGKQ